MGWTLGTEGREVDNDGGLGTKALYIYNQIMNSFVYHSSLNTYIYIKKCFTICYLSEGQYRHVYAISNPVDIQKIKGCLPIKLTWPIISFLKIKITQCPHYLKNNEYTSATLFKLL